MRTVITLAAFLAAPCCFVSAEESDMQVKGTFNVKVKTEVTEFTPDDSQQPTKSVVENHEQEHFDDVVLPQAPAQKQTVSAEGDDVILPISIRGPKNITKGDTVFAAIVTTDKTAVIEWQLKPAMDHSHWEVGQFGPGKWVMIFFDPPEGKYTILAVAKLVREGEDAVGVDWIETEVGNVTPTPIPPKDTDGDGLPDDKDPCPFDPHNICNDPVPPTPDPPTPPTPGPIAFDGAVIAVERTDLSDDHAVLLSNIGFWNQITNNNFKIYDEQDPEYTSRGYKAMLDKMGLKPPALILMKNDGTPVKAGPLPNNQAEVHTFIGK